MFEPVPHDSIEEEFETNYGQDNRVMEGKLHVLFGITIIKVIIDCALVQPALVQLLELTLLALLLPVHFRIKTPVNKEAPSK